jgi:hypothetical protein
MASILAHPQTFPPPGAGLLFFLATFAWPLLFAPLLLWIRRGPASILLRALEIPLLGWTSFMVLFAAGMDRSTPSYILVAGAVIYTIGAAWSDVIAVKAMKPVTYGSP